LARVFAAWGGSGRLDRAQSALTRALILDPRNSEALREMADILMSQRNYTDALAVADRLLSFRPDDAEMLYQKAIMLARDPEQLPESLALINRAIEQQDDAQFRSLRGSIYLMQQNYGDALLDLESAARGQRETTAQFDLALAEAYAGTGDRARAQRHLDAARQKASGSDALDTSRIERIEALLANEEQDA
jgi:lipopolysaccharide biosynthesis regulator YciM